MNIRFLAGAACSLALVFAAPVLADISEGETYLSIMASHYDDDVNRQTDDGISAWMFGVGYAMNRTWNIEGFVGINDAVGLVSQDHWEVGVDLQRVFNRDKLFTPYVFVGASALDIDIAGGPSENGVAYAAGAGFYVDIFGPSKFALRGEYRYRMDDLFLDNAGDQFVSLGLQIPFGDAREPMPVPAAEPPADPDSDGDGVPDSRDQCMSTPAGVKVDAKGCPLDSDRDGVADHMDECPNTVRGAKVDAKGCEMDGDNDGVVDRLDRCPNTRAGAQVDVAGCEIKEEIKLPGVNFESNAATLLSGTERVLNDAAETLKRNPEIKVEVAGHTDSDGAAAYNEDLSARRAETVRAYLAARGVAADRMTVRGYGESEPIAENTTPTGKAQNRRVVLRVTER